MEYLNIGLHHLHNVLRWAILIFGFTAVYKAYTGMSGKRAWESSDQKTGMWFVLCCHLQLLIGLILYFYLGKQSVFTNMAENMKIAEVRYWGIEHFLMMLIAIVLVQIGRIASKKAATDVQKHKKALIWYGIGLLLMLINIPWPWSQISRGLLPGM